MADIVLCTLNARWSHANLGLRCLRANLGPLRERSVIREFTINDVTNRMVEELLAEQPRLIGFGVYIWNLRETERLIATLKALRPDQVIVCGGPEVSHGCEPSALAELADCIVSGEGDLVFRQICEAVLDGGLPPGHIQAPSPAITELALPYGEYSDEDLARRVIYVEASRGCPFTCEFCLSSLDEKVRSFDLDHFLMALDDLIRRGCRTFKFVDRTFNLKPTTCKRILGFFHERWPRDGDGALVKPASTRQMDGGEARNEAFFLHFEMVPDRLPEVVRELVQQFPAGAIQFEVGIQSFTPEVGVNISRRMDLAKTEQNLAWLRDGGLVHVHADLIVGLPGETPESFLASYDQLFVLGPDEIQVGILKRLKGTPIARREAEHGLVFNPEPPYDLLASNGFPFEEMQRFKRFARYHELIVNSGHFDHGLAALLDGADSPGRSLLALSDWLWQQTHQEHGFARKRLFDLLLDYVNAHGLEQSRIISALSEDILAQGHLKGTPDRLRSTVEAASVRRKRQAIG